MGCISSREDEYQEIKEELMKVFEETGGKHSWKNKIHWGDKKVPLKYWRHVKVVDGKVVRLTLNDNRLKGKLPSFCISSLTELCLSTNYLEGPVPWKALMEMSHLEIVDLSCNKLNGEVPFEEVFSSWPLLKSFNISENYFECELSNDVWTSASNMMAFLDLHQNNFFGQINFSGASYITYMRQMPTRYVDIRDNPGIVFCESFSEEFSTLTELRLQHSSIGGSMPCNISICHSLSYLDLSWNNIIGPIPEDLYKLVHLTYLNLSHNRFTGSLSSQMSNFSKLKILDISSNEFHGELSCDSFSRCWELTVLDVSMNQFIINVMPRIAHLKHLSEVSFENNQIADALESNLTEQGFFAYRMKQDRRWMEIKQFIYFVHGYKLQKNDIPLTRDSALAISDVKLEVDEGKMAERQLTILQVFAITDLCLRIAQFL